MSGSAYALYAGFSVTSVSGSSEKVKFLEYSSKNDFLKLANIGVRLKLVSFDIAMIDETKDLLLSGKPEMSIWRSTKKVVSATFLSPLCAKIVFAAKVKHTNRTQVSVHFL